MPVGSPARRSGNHKPPSVANDGSTAKDISDEPRVNDKSHGTNPLLFPDIALRLSIIDSQTGSCKKGTGFQNRCMPQTLSKARFLVLIIFSNSAFAWPAIIGSSLERLTSFLICAWYWCLQEVMIGAISCSLRAWILLYICSGIPTVIRTIMAVNGMDATHGRHENECTP